MIQGQPNRWVSLVAGIYLMLVSGTDYMFGTYSADLKNQQNYTVSEINLIGTLGNIGLWAAILGGLFYYRYGARPTGFGGSFLIFLGYGSMYLASRINSFALMSLGSLVMGQGSAWLYGASLNVTAANFAPEDRGKVVGLLVCAFGLCAGFFSTLYNAFFGSNPTHFLLFCAIALSSGGFFATFFLQMAGAPTKSQAVSSEQTFRVRLGYSLALLMTALIVVAGLLQSFSGVSAVNLAIPLMVVAAGFPLIAVYPFTKGSFLGVSESAVAVNSTSAATTEGEREDPAGDSSTSSSSLLLASSSSSSTASAAAAAPHQVIVQASDSSDDDRASMPLLHQVQVPGLTFTDSLKRFDLWILFVIYFATVGTGITVINNLAEIVIALETVPSGTVIVDRNLPHHSERSALVMLVSAANTLGRLLFGLASDALTRYHHARLQQQQQQQQQSKGFLFAKGSSTSTSTSSSGWWSLTRWAPRPLLLAVCALGMAASQALLAPASLPLAFVAIAVLGISYGGLFCVVPTITTELVGLKSFAAIWGVMGIAPSIGSEVLASVLASTVSDHAAQTSYVDVLPKDTSTTTNRHCLGAECYRLTFLVNMGLSVGAVVLSLWLARRGEFLFGSSTKTMTKKSVGGGEKEEEEAAGQQATEQQQLQREEEGVDDSGSAQQPILPRHRHE